MAQHRCLLDRAIHLQPRNRPDRRPHERAFHKCLTTLLTNRIQNDKSQIGFESQERKTQLHELNPGLKTMQYTDQQRRFYADAANPLFELEMINWTPAHHRRYQKLRAHAKKQRQKPCQAPANSADPAIITSGIAFSNP